MSLYELLKREQARGHIFGQGIRVATFMDGNAKVSDTGHIVTLEDAEQMVSELTPRQRKVADDLQEFMQKKGGEWGNYVSVKRFGEKQFGEPHYFPINSDGRHLEVNSDENPSAASGIRTEKSQAVRRKRFLRSTAEWRQRTLKNVSAHTHG